MGAEMITWFHVWGKWRESGRGVQILLRRKEFGTGSVSYPRCLLHQAEHHLLTSTASSPAGYMAEKRELGLSSQAELGSNPSFTITPALGVLTSSFSNLSGWVLFSSLFKIQLTQKLAATSPPRQT